MNNFFRSDLVLEMLNAFGKVLNQLEIDFFLVGALARDIRLRADPAFAARRMTKDVDIAILLASEEQFYHVKDALIATGNFTPHEREAIKLFYKQAIEIDLLPFGEIENHARETRIGKPRPFVLDVPGFREVLPDAEQLVFEGTQKAGAEYLKCKDRWKLLGRAGCWYIGDMIFHGGIGFAIESHVFRNGFSGSPRSPGTAAPAEAHRTSTILTRVLHTS